jgi:AcrR family transcriptional regulator
MARPVDHERRARLLEAAVDFAIDNGIADLSLRPLASAVGVTPTTLLHHFGSKDELLEAILNRVRERIVETLAIGERTGEDTASLVRDIWAWTSDPGHQPLYRLFFAIYGRALQNPARFAPLLDRVVADWLTLLVPSIEAEGYDPNAARQRATLGVAVIRGLALDLLTTGDRDRADATLETFASQLAAGQEGTIR